MGLGFNPFVFTKGKLKPDKETVCASTWAELRDGAKTQKLIHDEDLGLRKGETETQHTEHQ